jgi:phosphoenolpyruvate synthase/pyruvate phosphate dikinase
LHIATSTDDKLLSCKFIWIVNEKTLESAVKQDSINRINYIVNVNQPDAAILMSKTSTDYFYGIFLTIENMNGIYKNINANIGQAIEESYIDAIVYYD